MISEVYQQTSRFFPYGIVDNCMNNMSFRVDFQSLIIGILKLSKMLLLRIIENNIIDAYFRSGWVK